MVLLYWMFRLSTNRVSPQTIIYNYINSESDTEATRLCLFHSYSDWLVYNTRYYYGNTLNSCLTITYDEERYCTKGCGKVEQRTRSVVYQHSWTKGYKNGYYCEYCSICGFIRGYIAK